MRHGYNKRKLQLCGRQTCGAQSVMSEHVGLIKYLLGLITTCKSFSPQNLLTKQQCYTVREREREREREPHIVCGCDARPPPIVTFAITKQQTALVQQLAADICLRARENTVTVSRNSQTNEGLCAKECNSESRPPLSFHTRFVKVKNYFKKTAQKQIHTVAERV